MDQVLRYAIEIAEALDQAHRKGVFHRDLKPGNIMSPVPIGLSTVPIGTEALTGKGIILGMLRYMAPEQLEGKETDARSDIFAFGAVLYEMATGRKAFDGKSAPSVMAAILERDPAPISTQQPRTPPGLDHVVQNCIAKDPEARWQTAADLAKELRRIAENGKQAPAPTFVAHGRGKWAWIAATAVASLIASGFAFVHFTRKTPEAAAVRFSFAPPFKADVCSFVRAHRQRCRVGRW
jgi:serine/threonine protein kinase